MGSHNMKLCIVILATVLISSKIFAEAKPFRSINSLTKEFEKEYQNATEKLHNSDLNTHMQATNENICEQIEKSVNNELENALRNGLPTKTDSKNPEKLTNIESKIKEGFHSIQDALETAIITLCELRNNEDDWKEFKNFIAEIENQPKNVQNEKSFMELVDSKFVNNPALGKKVKLLTELIIDVNENENESAIAEVESQPEYIMLKSNVKKLEIKFVNNSVLDKKVKLLMDSLTEAEEKDQELTMKLIKYLP